jgi:hypothetical protein
MLIYFNFRVIIGPIKQIIYMEYQSDYSHMSIYFSQESMYSTIYYYYIENNTWVRGNIRFISRVEHDISLVRCAHS